MRSRLPLFALLFALGSLALPLAAHAGGIPFFGPIIPSGTDAVCPAGMGLLLTVINNIISLLLTLAIVFVAPIMIAYSGFLFVVNSVNPEGKDKARQILTNTVVGIVVALAGWMIVDAIMAALYNPGASTGTSTLGAWANIVSGGDICLSQAGAVPGAGLNQATPSAGVTANAPNAGAIPAGTGQATYSITSVTPSGQQSITFNTTFSDSTIQQRYNVAGQYSSEINNACTNTNSSIPNCPVVVTALIAQESGNNSTPATTGCNEFNACGLMQLTSGGASCPQNDTACITNQITLGLQQLTNDYNSFQSVSDALAAYNSGASTQAGQSVSGKSSAMVNSTDCTNPQLYAWQCATNPGGLTQTQGYVANICRDIMLNGNGFNCN